MQHAQQIVITQSIVYHTHEFKQLAHLVCVEIAAARLGISGYALAQQHFQRLRCKRLH